MGDPSPFSSAPRDPTGELVVVGLGANRGARRESMEGAIGLLAERFELLGVSPLYESEPVGGPPQGRFLNAAALLGTGLPLSDVLGELLGIELQFGRERLERWGPRTLDLDILWAGTRTHATSSLTVPHPELLRRRFALRPLLDLIPDAKGPLDNVRYDEILSRLEGQPLALIEDENWWKRSPR